MGLLDVEREDLIGHGPLGHEQGQDGLRAELFHGGEAVVSVRRPVLRLGRPLAHGDDRIEEAFGLVHGHGQSAHVGVRDVALERGGRDLFDRQRGQEERVTSERLPVHR